jgi:putative flippase GtrA
MRLIDTLSQLLKKLSSIAFIKFLAVGTFNTFFGYFIYGGLLYFIDYKYAYTVSYIISIIGSYLLNSIFVFNSKLSLKKALQFPLVYISQYVLGIAMLYVLVDKIHTPKLIAPPLS